jgi:histidinol-phosphate aminotransferase
VKVSADIESLVPYVAGKPISEVQRQYNLDKVVKLASNENPLGVSPKVMQAMQTAMHEIHRYPDASLYDLISALEKNWKIPRQNLTVGNGSEDIIDLLIRVFCEPGDAILSFQHSFIAYRIRAQAARVQRVDVPVNADFHMDLQAMAQILRAEKTAKKIKLVFLANPNNPTGAHIPHSEVVKFLSEFGNDPDLLIVFDEAYSEFVRVKDSAVMLNLFQNYKSVVVSRTLSKVYGLAGLRVGVLAAPAMVIEYINRVRNPFNVSGIAQAAAIAALDDKEFLQNTVELAWQGLDYCKPNLESLGFKVFPSQANFLLFDCAMHVGTLNQALLKRGVILRPVLNYGIDSCLRMSMGTMEENQFAIKALKSALQEVKSS